MFQFYNNPEVCTRALKKMFFLKKQFGNFGEKPGSQILLSRRYYTLSDVNKLYLLISNFNELQKQFLHISKYYTYVSDSALLNC